MKYSQGFSLPEVLIFVTIVAILFLIASPYLYSKSDYAKVGQAQVRLLAIESALKAHVQDWGSVPADFNDPYNTTLAFRVRSATSPVCPRNGTYPKETGVVTFLPGILGLGFYNLGMYCPLTTPVRYLEDENFIDPFGDGTIMMGYDSKWVSNPQSMQADGSILYGASFSAGPDRVAGDWLRGTPLAALAYTPTNGIRSRGEMWIIVPNPGTETGHAPHLMYNSWEFHYGTLRSFATSDE